MKFRNIYHLTGLILVLLWSCSKGPGVSVSDHPAAGKLCPVVVMQPDSTVLVVSDYFNRDGRIDSLQTDEAVQFRFSSDSSLITLKPGRKSIPLLSVMTCWIKGYSYDLLVEKSQKVKYRFTFNPGKNRYKKVQLTGQFNDWNPQACPMIRHDSVWQAILSLNPGRYQYRLVADGKWMPDPACSEKVNNGSGDFNSLLIIGNAGSPQLPVLSTLSCERSSVVISITGKTDSVLVFWQNHRLDSKFVRRENEDLRILIPSNAGSVKRSYLRAWAYNKYGISNDLLIPLENGKVIQEISVLGKNDLQKLIVYFMMVDRFSDGDSTNNGRVADKDVDPKVNFMGGDIRGITKKLDEGYFSDLGVNALWISPVGLNPPGAFVEYPAPHRKYSAYHGYWPLSLTLLDPRFGSGQDLSRLVSEAHSKDIRVILDFVSHHVHQDCPLLKQFPNRITPVDLPGKRKNIRLFDEQRLTTWFDIFLPTWDFSRPEVIRMVSDSAVYWIATYGLDGFRHDAAKHIPEPFWRTLTHKLDSVQEHIGNKVYQIGETFGSRELTGSYVSPGMLDAQFDFNLYWDARNAFADKNSSFRDLAYSLQQSFQYYGYHHLMGNISGNQDLARFISYASGSLKFYEDANAVAWKREVGVDDTLGYARLAQMMAFNMTVPGVPVIYYGDEFGMPGAGDPDNRRMMKFRDLNPQELRLKQTVSRLCHLRSSELPLIFGDFRIMEMTDKTMVFIRTYFNRCVIVMFNKDSRPRDIRLPITLQFVKSTFKPLFGSPIQTGKSGPFLNLKPCSFEILTNE